MNLINYFKEFCEKENQAKKMFYEANNILYSPLDLKDFSNETVKKFIETEKKYFSGYNSQFRIEALKIFLEKIKNEMHINLINDFSEIIQDSKSLEKQKSFNFQIILNRLSSCNPQKSEEQLKMELENFLFKLVPNMTARKFDSIFTKELFEPTNISLIHKMNQEFGFLLKKGEKSLKDKYNLYLEAEQIFSSISNAFLSYDKESQELFINDIKIFAHDESLFKKQEQDKEPSTKNELDNVEVINNLKINQEK